MEDKYEMERNENLFSDEDVSENIQEQKPKSFFSEEIEKSEEFSEIKKTKVHMKNSFLKEVQRMTKVRNKLTILKTKRVWSFLKMRMLRLKWFN